MNRQSIGALLTAFVFLALVYAFVTSGDVTYAQYAIERPGQETLFVRGSSAGLKDGCVIVLGKWGATVAQMCGVSAVYVVQP